MKNPRMKMKDPRMTLLEQGCPGIHIVQDRTSYREVTEFRERQYARHFDAVPNLRNDPFDRRAVIYYSRASDGTIASTARLAFEGPEGLPEENLVSECLASRRRQGLKMAELGRMISKHHSFKGMLDIYRLVYFTALLYCIDGIVLVVKQKQIRLYTEHLGAELLVENTGETFGSDAFFAALVWDIANTKQAFIRRIGAVENPINESIGEAA